MNIIKTFLFNNILVLLTVCVIILFYQYKMNRVNIWIFLIIPISLFIYYLLKLLKDGYNFSLNDCLCYVSNQLLTNKITSIELIKPHLLDKPLHEFYISTSHNTYLPCHQNIDISSVDAIKNALQLGARVIELDVYAKNNIGLTDDDYTPVVAHGMEYKYGDIFTTSYITFEECIKTIAEFAQTTSDPIWITLELNTNKLVKTQIKMREILLKYFENKIINSTTKLNNIPIKNVLNKIILTCGGGITPPLEDIVNPYLKNTYHKDSNLKNNNLTGIIHRIYPAGDIQGHFSYNFDPEPLWKNRYQLIALNFQKLDDNLNKNLSMFNKCSFVHFSEYN
jgi:hypothetical protein